ncbi:MAG: class I SAM-dependent methyltransferase [Gammaproteobacteria bacterium]|nr:class I SAM-dependent methyltransferase [Gammaproteobacteria bacterium]
MESVQMDPYAEQKSLLPKAIRIQNLFLRNVRRSVVDMLQRYGATDVLDACSGGGALAHMIGTRGMKVQAVDRSPTMADYSRSHYGILTKVALIESLKFRERFDAAVIGMTLHELSEGQREEVWQGLEQAVKNTGVIIAVDYTTPPAGLLNEMFGKLLRLDEATFETVNPGHYEDYVRFMQQGGLLGWLEQRGEYIHSLSTHLMGNIAVAVVMK